MRRRVLLTLSLAAALGHADTSMAQNAGPSPLSRPSTEQASAMKIGLKIGDKVLTATLADNPSARDFVSLLPLTLTMDDLFGREKFGHLPRAISGGGPRARSYEVGQVIYWSPGPDVAIFYRDDGQSIPSPGIIVLGKIDGGIDALNVRGSVNVTIELID